jgi:hypothetical protein
MMCIIHRTSHDRKEAKMMADRLIEFYASKSYSPENAGYPVFYEALRAWFNGHERILRHLDKMLEILTANNGADLCKEDCLILRKQNRALGIMLEKRLQTWDKDPYALQKVMAQQCRHCKEAWDITQEINTNGAKKEVPQPVDVSGIFAGFIPDP